MKASWWVLTKRKNIGISNPLKPLWIWQTHVRTKGNTQMQLDMCPYIYPILIFYPNSISVLTKERKNWVKWLVDFQGQQKVTPFAIPKFHPFGCITVTCFSLTIGCQRKKATREILYNLLTWKSVDFSHNPAEPKTTYFFPSAHLFPSNQMVPELVPFFWSPLSEPWEPIFSNHVSLSKRSLSVCNTCGATAYANSYMFWDFQDIHMSDLQQETNRRNGIWAKSCFLIEMVWE